MNKSEWQSEVIPAQCIKFKLIKNALGTQINGVQVETIETAEKLCQEPLKSIWRAY